MFLKFGTSCSVFLSPFYVIYIKISSHDIIPLKSNIFVFSFNHLNPGFSTFSKFLSPKMPKSGLWSVAKYSCLHPYTKCLVSSKAYTKANPSPGTPVLLILSQKSGTSKDNLPTLLAASHLYILTVTILLQHKEPHTLLINLWPDT